MTPKRASRKLPCESLNSLENPVPHAAEPEDDTLAADYAHYLWVNSVSERYKRDEYRLHGHFSGAPNNFCAVFQYYGGSIDDNPVPDMLRLPCRSRDGKDASRSPDDLHYPMLVRNVEVMEDEKSVSPVPSVALVWLQPLDHCLMFRADANKPRTLGTAKIVCSEADRKPGMVCRCFPVEQHQLIHQVVERGSEVVGDLPYIDSPFEGELRAIHDKAVDIFSRIRILLLPEMILGIAPEGFVGFSEVCDFTFCSPYLEARAVERMRANR